MQYLSRDGILFSLVGPTGSGKTTVRSRLLADNPKSARASISVTTRSPRPGEKAGVNYEYISDEEFKRRVSQGLFFEWEEIHGKFYGTPRSNVENAIEGGYDLILDIDIKGAFTFRKAYPGHAVIVFMLPPSVQALKDRICARGGVVDAELDKRLVTARAEYDTLLQASERGGNVDYVVVNDNLEETYTHVAGILSAERGRLSRIRYESLKKICSL